MNVHHNDAESFIDDPEDSCLYHIWLLSGHKGKTLHITTTQVSTIKLVGGSTSHVFTGIKMFTYIIPINCNVQIINRSKAPAKLFGLVISFFQKQTLLYHSGHNTICHKNRKTQQVKLHLNIIQSIQKCKNRSSQMGKNHHRYRKETQSRNKSQIKISTVMGFITIY